MRVWGIVLGGVLAACSSPQTAAPAPSAASATPASTQSAAPQTATPAADAGAPASAEPAPAPALTFEQVKNTLGVTGSSCPESLPTDARIRCLYDERYRGDPKAASLGYELFTRWQILTGVERAYTMDGGYRGMIRIEPAVPTGADRKHLEWIVAAFRDIEQVFAGLDKVGADAGAPAATTAPKRYRFHPITLRFFRSVAARTPSAYALDWTVAWNLNGSLHVSGDAVRETLVHEIFHLNDATHPDAAGEYWSIKGLGPDFDTIVHKCGTKIPCLGPFTPAETIVRGGTYYSFQPGNGVREYAAELASRYVREQRAVQRGTPLPKAFKCGPPENGRAWAAIRDEFFSGIDAVPACP